MKNKLDMKVAKVLVLVAALGGCQTLPPPEPAVPQSVEPQEPAADQPAVPAPPTEPPPDLAGQRELELKQAIEIYWDGRYDEAITRLTPLPSAPELSLSSQIKAVKFMAFSNCVIGRLAACKRNFTTALAQDPTFRLDAAEKGHPVWGRQFDLALAEFQKKPDAQAKKKVSSGVAGPSTSASTPKPGTKAGVAPPVRTTK